MSQNVKHTKEALQVVQTQRHTELMRSAHLLVCAFSAILTSLSHNTCAFQAWSPGCLLANMVLKVVWLAARTNLSMVAILSGWEVAGL